MALMQRKFKTIAEAEAFAAGIRYVNDPTIHILGIQKNIGKNVIVFFEDLFEDLDEEEEEA